MTPTIVFLSFLSLSVALIVFRAYQAVRLYKNDQPFTDAFVSKMLKNHQHDIDKALLKAK